MTHELTPDRQTGKEEAGKTVKKAGAKRSRDEDDKVERRWKGEKRKRSRQKKCWIEGKKN